jgi:hypothetical protein
MAAFAWALGTCFYDSPGVRRGFLLLPALFPLLFLADLARPLLVLGATAIFIPLFHVTLRGPSSEKSTQVLFVSLFGAVPLLVVYFVHVGRFVWKLDLPLTVALFGLLVLLASLSLWLRSLALASSRSRSHLVAALGGAAFLVGGLAGSLIPVEPRIPAHAPDGRPNMVLIVWDTVRAQELQEYGYEHSLGQAFSRIAERGVTFDDAIAPNCWTLPTHGSMFTGLWPRSHGAMGLLPLETGQDNSELADWNVTIAERLHEAGYETVGISGNYYNAGTKSNMDQGFEHFTEPGLSAMNDTTPMRLIESFLDTPRYDEGAMLTRDGLRRWLMARRPDRPFFLFINYYEPHSPYEPRTFI